MKKQLHKWTHMMLVGALLFVAACAEKKQLGEMHDATVEMNETTKQLAQTSKNMEQTTSAVAQTSGKMSDKMDTMVDKMEKVNTRIDEMKTEVKSVSELADQVVDIGRQGGSSAERREALEAMKNSASVSGKLAEAVKYFESFEMQVWTGIGPDKKPESRTALINDGVKEFFKAVKEFAPEEARYYPFAKIVTPIEDNASENRLVSYNALSATMHYKNRKQAEIIEKNPGLKSISMYSLIEETLKIEKDVNEGRIQTKDLAEYQHVILVNRDAAIDLLQTRHNMIGAIFLSEMMGKKDAGQNATKTNLMYFWESKWELIKKWDNYLSQGLNYYLNFGATWSSDMDRYNLSQLQEQAKYLKAVLQTRALLNSLGVAPAANDTLTAFLSSLKMKSEGKGGADVNAARLQVMDLFAQVQKDPTLKK